MSRFGATPAGRVALCGVLAALGVVIMSLGTLLPVATFCAPMLASLLALPVLRFCGQKYAWLWYGAVSLLSLMLAPDREAAFIFLVLGYYPVLRPRISKLPKPLFLLCKLLIFNGAAALVFWVLQLLGLPTVVTEFPNASGWVLYGILAAFLLLFNIVFLLYDSILPRLDRIITLRGPQGPTHPI